MKRENIIKKIEGLLKLARDHGSDEESMTAFAHAQRLMAKYNVEEGDIKGEETIEERVIIEKSSVLWYEKVLSNIIAKNYRCKMYMSRSRMFGSRVVMVGYKDDVDMAEVIYNMALGEMRHYASIEVKKMKGLASAHDVRTSYQLGYLEGLAQVLDTSREDIEAEYGLVVQTPQAVIDHLAGHNLRPAPMNVSLNASKIEPAYNNGYAQGAAFTRKEQIEG